MIQVKRRVEGAEIQVTIVAQHDHIVKCGLKRLGREKMSIAFDCSGEKNVFDTHIVHYLPFFLVLNTLPWHLLDIEVKHYLKNM